MPMTPGRVSHSWGPFAFISISLLHPRPPLLSINIRGYWGAVSVPVLFSRLSLCYREASHFPVGATMSWKSILGGRWLGHWSHLMEEEVREINRLFRLQLKKSKQIIGKTKASSIVLTWNRPLRVWGGFRGWVSFSSLRTWLLEGPSNKETGMKNKKGRQGTETKTHRHGYKNK